MTHETAETILDFWFSERISEAWFARNDEVDREIGTRFSDTYEAARNGALDAWRDAPRDALALTILLDQFPRNLFRGSARSFESDARARDVAKHALAHGFDREVSERERQFFYLPLMHSEHLDDQRRCVELYRELGNEITLEFAIKHHDIVERFGRFPHRNAVTGRETTPEEAEFLKDNPGF